MKRKVLISGASVAGPSLAYWLAKDGWDVTVVEKAQGIRPGGYAIDFRGTAIEVLRKMELLDAVKAHETRAGKITVEDAREKTVARFPDGFTSGEVEILRGQLAQVFYEATREQAKYIFGDSIQGIVQDENGADVTFASGQRERYDIVVGADGLHSNTRALAFGEEEKFVRSMGYCIAIFSVPDFLQLGDAGRYYVQLGKRAGIFGSKNEGNAKASLYMAADGLQYERRDAEAQKQMLREAFRDVPWHTSRLLEYMEAAPDFYFDVLAQVRMEQWSSGRVVLLGDAAWCASPMSGMGTSMAVVGAYLLAKELNECHGDYGAAFAKYEAVMRPFVNEAQKMAEGVSWFIPKSRMKLWFSNKMWSLMPKKTLHKLMVEQPGQVARMVEV